MVCEYPRCRIRDGSNRRVRNDPSGTFVIIRSVDEDGTAIGSCARFDVPPSVTNEVTSVGIDSVAACSFDDETSAWFSAEALVGVVVWAHEDIIQHELALQPLVNRIDDRSRRGAAGDVRLVGNADEQEFRGAQSVECLPRARADDQLLDTLRRIRFSVADDGFVEDAIPVEENRLTHLNGLRQTDALPLRFVCFDRRMRDDQVPDDRLKRFRMWRDMGVVDHRNENHGIRDFCRVTAISTDDAVNRCADALGEFERAHQIRTHVFLKIATADAEHENRIARRW